MLSWGVDKDEVSFFLFLSFNAKSFQLRIIFYVLTSFNSPESCKMSETTEETGNLYRFPKLNRNKQNTDILSLNPSYDSLDQALANEPLVEPWLARLDGKCDLKTKMTINQELRTWTRNIFACWLLLVDSTNFTSGLLASLAPFGGQTDLHDLQNNLSSKAIWTPKTTFHGVMSEVKSVALIPTSSKLSLNPL